MTAARMKLAKGPAKTTAARCQTGLLWNDPACISGVSSTGAPGARGVGVVEEFDVAAERDGRDAPARAVPVVEAPELAAESDGEGRDGHAAPAGHEEVAELVEEHHHAQHEQEREHEHGCSS